VARLCAILRFEFLSCGMAGLPPDETTYDHDDDDEDRDVRLKVEDAW